MLESDRHTRHTLVKSVEFYYTLPNTPLWSYHSSTEPWSLSIKSVELFYSTLGVDLTTHFVCNYKLSHCLPTSLSYSPFESLPACRSDCLSNCLCLSLWLPVCVSFS